MRRRRRLFPGSVMSFTGQGITVANNAKFKQADYGDNISPTRAATGSMWFKPLDTSTMTWYTFRNWLPGGGIAAWVTQAGAVSIFAYNSSNTEILEVTASGSYLVGAWNWLSWSFNLTAGTTQIRFNDTLLTPTVSTLIDDDISFSVDLFEDISAIGNFTDVSADPEGSFGELYLKLGTALDLSDSGVLNKFRTVKTAISLGSQGELPAGAAADWYFSGGPAAFTTNRGALPALAFQGTPGLDAGPIVGGW